MESKHKIGRNMQIVFISGAYSGTKEQTSEYISIARKAAIKYWELGYAVICPHLNSQGMEEDAEVTYAQWLDGYIAILEVCDIVVFLPNWKESQGAACEFIIAQGREKKMIFLDLNLEETLLEY